MSRQEIIEARGDFNAEYMGEFYDQKYGWEDLGKITFDEATILKRFKILE